MGNSIVVGTDGSASAERAIDEAVRLALALDADLHVVSAYEPLRARVTGAPQGAADVWAPLPDSKVESILSQTEASVRMRNVAVSTHAIHAEPADAILEVAREVGAEMIVVGSKGMHGARRHLPLGNVPNAVSHRARCNVLIVNTD